MIPANLFQLEVLSVVANRRALVMRLLLPVVMSMPFVLTAMPVRVKTAGLVMLLLFLTFFGAAVTMVRRESEGHRTKLSLLPIPGWLVQVDFVLSGAVIDILQIGGVIVLFLLLNAKAPVSGSLIFVLAGMFVVSVIVLNFLGMLLAGAVKNNVEVHLIGALTVGVIALVSGLFPVPAGIAQVIAAGSGWNPIAQLAAILTSLAEDNSETMEVSALQMWTAAIALVALLVGLLSRMMKFKSSKQSQKTSRMAPRV